MAFVTLEPYEFTAQGDYRNDFYCRVNIADDTDNAANTSRPVITALQFKSKYWSPNAWVDGTIKADGVPIIEFSEFRGTHSVDITKGAGYSPVTAHGDNPNAPWYGQPIVHNNDGSKSVTLTVDLYLRFMDGGRRVDFHDERTVNLAQIPRASSVGAADGNIEGVATVSVTPKSAAYTHSLQYVFGSVTGWIDADGNPVSSETKITQQSIPFKVPTSFYSQIPNAKSGICTIRCRTYSGNTQIGDTQETTFEANAKYSLCRPIVSGSAIDVNPQTVNLTGNNKIVVRYMSTVEAKISAQARNGATIQAEEINGISGETITISDAQAGDFYFAAMDSRGYSTGYTENLTVIPYVRLTANIEYERPDATKPTVIVKVTGNYFNGSFGKENNVLEMAYSLDGLPRRSMDVINKHDGYYDAQVTLQLPYDENHSIQVFASDRIISISPTETISRGIPAWLMGKNYWKFNVPLLAEVIKGATAQEFANNLEDVYKLCATHSATLVTIDDASSPGSGPYYCGILYKYTNDYGFIDVTSYAASRLYRAKVNGVWQDWIYKDL